MNECKFIGSVHRIEQRQTSGVAITTATLRVSNGKDKTTGDWRDPTFVNLTAWGRDAETLNNTPEKSRLFVCCRYSPRKYPGSDGQERTSHGFNVLAIYLLKPFDNQQSTQAHQPGQKHYQAANQQFNQGQGYEPGPVDDDDIPF